jgi:uroporphyrinogen-III synthase
MEVLGYPLFEILAVPWQTPDLILFDALVFTSAAALRAGGEGLEPFKALPSYCVGEATALAAKEAGFKVKKVGRGSATELLQNLPSERLLHFCGTDVTAKYRKVQQVAVYESRPIIPDKGFWAALDRNPIIVVHSPRSGRRIAELVKNRQSISIVAISEEAAVATGPGWEAVAVADKPRDDAILAAVASLLKEQEEQNI